MQVLFDQGTPVPLRRYLSAHTVTTVFEKGWSRMQNGELLRTAEDEAFKVLVTTDQNLKYQQNLSGRALSIVVLSTTSWPVIEQQVDRVADVINTITPGSYVEITF
jgi:predicted nuclease of predicted toxin-antitoxin system